MRNLKVFGILTLLIALCILMSVLVPESFLSPNNIENLLRRTALYGVLAIGVAFVIITAGIDLSIGSIVCLSGCLLALLLQVDYNPPDRQEVIELRAADREIWLDADAKDAFQVGDQLYYYGGRLAESAVRIVESVAVETVDAQTGPRKATILTVNAPLSRDDFVGSVARVFSLQNLTTTNNSAAASLTIAGRHSLTPRDRVGIVQVSSGRKVRQFTVAAADSQPESTQIRLQDQVDSTYDNSHVAVPLPRRQRMPVVLGVGLVLVVGALLGWLHGMLITKVHLQPFVVTLCGLLIYRSMARWLVSDQPRGFGDEYDASLMPLVKAKVIVADLASGESFGIPIPFFIFLVIAVVSAIFLGMTVWGRYMMALGRSKEAADYSGINTDRMTILAYVLSAVLAAFGGMLFALDSNSVSPSSFGNSFELFAIAAAVLGGCSLHGGEGGIFGVAVGTVLMQVLKNLILFLSIPDTLEQAIIGGVILIGVVVDEIFRAVSRRRK